MRPAVKRRLWILSDLQQSLPERATACMTRAVRDFLSLQLEVEAVCYLGDAVEGHDLGFLRDMSAMQVRELSKVQAPIFYALGNHDFDYYRYHEKDLARMTLPFYEAVSEHPQWRVGRGVEDMAFFEDFGDFALAFLPDHAAKDGRWYTTHGEVRGDADAYPNGPEAYQGVCDKIEGFGKPVITLSHYAFAGGNRPAPLLDRLLPLPGNVRLHLYGHAHIGDAYWAGKDCHRKIAGVDRQPLVQVDVASLENYRGSAIRSVILEWYRDQSIGVYFRNHTLCRWDECYVAEA
ncbi:MAG TPA: metallophosphoesterase [Clostridia bacterium]|nr:metallophosphoesterase [Clostridia bacterium]